MNTQTHMLMGAALFGRPMPRLAWAAVAGGIAPDVPMYAIIAGLLMMGFPMREIFDRLYWSDWWQIANAVGHSFLLWGALVALSLVLLPRPWSARFAAQRVPESGVNSPAPSADRTRRFAPLLFAIAASALLLSAIDFLVHRDDGHMHFWPLTEWRFQSPVSYWDPAHGGNWFGLFEAAIGVLLIVVLFRRYRSRRVRALLALALVLYAAVPAYFILGIAHH